MATRATDDDGKLLFGAEHDGSGKLLFGDAGGSLPPAPPATVSVDASLPGLGSLALRVARQLALEADLPGLDGSVALVWDANVSRAMQQRVHAHWQDGAARHAAAASHWQDGPAQGHRAGSHWQDGSARALRAASHWQDSQPRRARAASHWQDAAPRSARTGAHWQAPRLLDVRTASHWQDGDRRQGATQVIWQEGLRLRALVADHWQDGDLRRLLLGHASAAGLPIWQATASHWQDARRPPSGQSHVAPIQPQRPPCYDEATAGRLVFTDAWGAVSDTLGRLVFVCGRGGHDIPPALIVIPRARVYMHYNHITLTLIGNGHELPAYDFEMSIDHQSWTWRWSATVHRDCLPDLAAVRAGQPLEINAKVNRETFSLLIESCARDRRHGQTRLRLQGRGLAARLDAPYAPTLNFANEQERTAHQLMLDALTVNGVSMGWTVDWRLTDWLVPGEVWSYQGTWIGALNTIAAAAGGYIQPQAQGTGLRVLPLYPRAPWEWAHLAPDIELPMDPVVIESVEWLAKPAYNRVHVSGESAGVLAQVTRSGTAGDTAAPMVVDALITAQEAASQRAKAILADTGAQSRVTLRLPVFEQTGLILPGRFLRRVDGAETLQGLVRATSVSFEGARLRQVLEVQCHG